MDSDSRNRPYQQECYHPCQLPVATRRFSLIFNFGCGPSVISSPVFVGLTPGQIGLYQVNFIVPKHVTCPSHPVGPGAISSGNLTLLSNDWVSSDTVLLYLEASPGPSAEPQNH